MRRLVLLSAALTAASLIICVPGSAHERHSGSAPQFRPAPQRTYQAPVLQQRQVVPRNSYQPNVFRRENNYAPQRAYQPGGYAHAYQARGSATRSYVSGSYPHRYQPGGAVHGYHPGSYASHSYRPGSLTPHRYTAGSVYRSGTHPYTARTEAAHGARVYTARSHYRTANPLPARRSAYAGSQLGHPNLPVHSLAQAAQTAATASHRVRVNTNTTVVAQRDHHGVIIQRKNPDGSQTFTTIHRSADGSRQVQAFRVARDARAGTVTRLYSDGRRVTIGHDFVMRSAPGRLAITTHANGLREARLPNGKPAFREAIAMTRDRSGRVSKTMIRTVYARVAHGRAYMLRSPVRQVYSVLSYHGRQIYAYRPWLAPRAFYDPFSRRFYRPIAVSHFCGDCADDGVVFAGDPEVYSDPVDVVADMQVADGFEDGMSGDDDDVATADGADDPDAQPETLGAAGPDPDTVALQTQASEMQAQVDDEQQRNGELRAALADQQYANASVKQRTPAPPRMAKARIVVPASAREQLHRQVKQDIALEKSQTPLSIADVVASAEAQNYIFQVSAMIDATDMSAGIPCVLSTGDLIKFDQVPGDQDDTAQVKIVTGKTGSCGAGMVVEVSIADLQDMLSAFSQRLEANMKKAHDRIAQAAAQMQKADRG